ncbi:phosphatidylinositol transfer protein 3 [Canna indica]|uniref:Phosphatidylinositol transfer protein 3 n=1 Tax=Canna indica TaxID=4628 RepID=A0AAQ3JM65_9LILI|nr:phosphatidylinositol transfer protein 3 [Canna indica]
MSSVNYNDNGFGKRSLTDEQQSKINEVRASLGVLPEKLYLYCTDASITRYLVARNWNVKKATKMLKETLKWRLHYKPEEILWDEVAHEAETGKIYRSIYHDKYGRSILVMRPGRQNTKSTKGQIRYLVYCMENAILNLPPEQEQMVWLIDFQGFNMSHISVKVTKETADILQNHYPERLGLAILYDPPKLFEPFWKVVRPFLDPKTFKKVKFVYPSVSDSKKIMEDTFNMDELDCAFGGKNQFIFNVDDYATRMREEDKRMLLFWSQGNASSCEQPSLTTPDATFSKPDSASDSDESEKESHGRSEVLDRKISPEDCVVDLSSTQNGNGSSHGNTNSGKDQ